MSQAYKLHDNDELDAMVREMKLEAARRNIVKREIDIIKQHMIEMGLKQYFQGKDLAAFINEGFIMQLNYPTECVNDELDELVFQAIDDVLSHYGLCTEGVGCPDCEGELVC